MKRMLRFLSEAKGIDMDRIFDLNGVIDLVQVSFTPEQ